jgi:hypothetical protein
MPSKVRYRYYRLAETLVRVSYVNGLKSCAEIVDQETGQYRIDNLWLSKIEQNWEVEEIKEAEFFESPISKIISRR